MRKWNYDFDVPERKKVRVLVYTDAKNEADDQFAIAHHLMTPKFMVKGIIAAHFNGNPQEYGAGHTAEASFKEVEKVLKLMDVEGICPVVRGSEYPLADDRTPIASDGAKMIIEEAMRDDPHPLFIACQGSITDLASAILMKPEICGRMTAIWIGGGDYPKGRPEFNLEQDIRAANILFSSKMPVWQIPMNVYKQMSVTLAELQLNVKPCGAIGKYLFEQMVDFNNRHGNDPWVWPAGELWGLGDSPTVGVLLEESEKDDIYDMIKAPTILPDMRYSFDNDNREIRVYKTLSVRTYLADFYAKLKINYGS